MRSPSSSLPWVSKCRFSVHGPRFREPVQWSWARAQLDANSSRATALLSGSPFSPAVHQSDECPRWLKEPCVTLFLKIRRRLLAGREAPMHRIGTIVFSLTCLISFFYLCCHWRSTNLVLQMSPNDFIKPTCRQGGLR